MAKNILGIEIGSTRLKIAELDGTKVIRFQTFDLPENMMQGRTLIAWDAMAETLRSCISAGGFKARKVALAINDEETYLRKTTLPVMNDDQLMTNIPYEYRDILSEEKDKYIYDYSMIQVLKDESGKPSEMELLIAAVSKKLIEKYQELFKKAGLKLIAARPRTLAIAAYLRTNSKAFTQKDIAILDLGNTSTEIDIFHNGVYEVTRSIEVGVNSIVDAAADVLMCDPHIAREFLRSNKDDVQNNEKVLEVYDRITTEIMRAMNYYSFENPDNTLDTLYYFGGGAWITPLLQDIAANVALQLTPFSEFDKKNVNPAIDGPAAIGVCLE